MSKTLKSHYNLFTKAVEFMINSFKVIIFFQLRFKISYKLLNSLSITDFVFCLLDSIWKSYYYWCSFTFFDNSMIKKCDLMMCL